MDILKKLFPLSFRFAAAIGNLIVGILIYLVVAAIGGAILSVIGILAVIPILGWLLGIVLGLVGSLMDIYCLAGIVIAVLVFIKVLK